MKSILSKRRSMAARLALVGLVASAAGAFAHEGHRHQAMGVVELIHENHLVLTLADEKERTFVVSEATRYLRGEVEAKREGVVAGERAVVMYETKDGADLALEVRLAAKQP